MKHTAMYLDAPLRIIPINGKTSVTIVSDGEYLLAKSATAGANRIRSITLADTGTAKFSTSPMRQNMTLKITLPSFEASKEEFIRQAMLVIEMAAKQVSL